MSLFLDCLNFVSELNEFVHTHYQKGFLLFEPIVDLVIFNSHKGLEQFCNRISGAERKKMVILGKQLQIFF